uniref:Uncharacterized protein n=1 Tax=Fibrocapsa japonica TaxID=94617 RepID=A0A7S2US77_9STRA
MKTDCNPKLRNQVNNSTRGHPTLTCCPRWLPCGRPTYQAQPKKTKVQREESNPLSHQSTNLSQTNHPQVQPSHKPAIQSPINSQPTNQKVQVQSPIHIVLLGLQAHYTAPRSQAPKHSSQQGRILPPTKTKTHPETCV